MAKKIKIYLKPSDFRGNSFLSSLDCPCDRALRSHFKTQDEVMFVDSCRVNGVEYKVHHRGFDGFDEEFVRGEYLADPKMEKTQYYIEISKM